MGVVKVKGREKERKRTRVNGAVMGVFREEGNREEETSKNDIGTEEERGKRGER